MKYEKVDGNNRSSKNVRNKPKHYQEMVGTGKGKKGKKGSERLEGLWSKRCWKVNGITYNTSGLRGEFGVKCVKISENMPIISI